MNHMIQKPVKAIINQGGQVEESLPSNICPAGLICPRIRWGQIKCLYWINILASYKNFGTLRSDYKVIIVYSVAVLDLESQLPLAYVCTSVRPSRYSFKRDFLISCRRQRSDLFCVVFHLVMFEHLVIQNRYRSIIDRLIFSYHYGILLYI